MNEENVIPIIDTILDHGVEKFMISKEFFNRLIKDSEFLNCLEACGVDCWEGYEEAQEMCGEE